LVIYGIKNCDTCKKAIKWLTEHDISFRFHDLRKDGTTTGMVDGWLSKLDHDLLINKRGTTYRNLEDAEKATLEGDQKSRLLVESPTLMKRPIFEIDDACLVGFKGEQQAKLLQLVSSQ
jgi:Spx/MgsR family transcriptional regulator